MLAFLARHVLLNAVYGLIILVALPWLIVQSIRTGKYRTGYGEKLLGRVPLRLSNRECIWLHAVSVGEVNLLKTVVAELRQARSDVELVISTTTDTGHALASKLFPDLTVFYCPLDFSWAVETALSRVRPTLLILSELELWPNLVAGAAARGIPVAIINARLSERSHRGYHRVRPVFRAVLRGVQLIAAQDEASADRFRDLGADPQTVFVSGNIKFDGAETRRDNPRTLALQKLAGFAPNDIVFLAGSTQEPEERLAVETFAQLSAEHPALRLVVVPRHRERFDVVAALLGASGLTWQRRSQIESRSPDPSCRILLVDTVGELAAWWGTAAVAFVGGSLGTRGGQNMLEPAGYAAAVSFGPKTRNFRDIVSLLLANDAATVVADGEQLTAFVRQCLTDPDWAREHGRRAQRLVLAGQGATQRTVARLLGLLTTESGEPVRRAA
jgi:3-deoxy-D-manno-octulosonic-acid transferase